MSDEYFSISDCNCGPFFFPNFVRCFFSKHFNCECYCHDVAYREQKESRSIIDKEFLEATLKVKPDGKKMVYAYYYFVRMTSWFSWYLIKLDNHWGATKWGKKMKKDGYIYETPVCYKDLHQ